MAALLKLNERDNVRIALQKMPAGSEVEGLRILDGIPSGHKIAIQQIEKDAAIEITEGEYKGLVFQFGKVQFKEGEPHINFQRTIRRLPDIVEEKSDKEIDKLLNNKELEQVMGDILVEIMQDQIERE